jgi:hypothetical protein
MTSILGRAFAVSSGILGFSPEPAAMILGYISGLKGIKAILAGAGSAHPLLESILVVASPGLDGNGRAVHLGQITG